VLIDW